MSERMVTECDNGSTILERLTKMFHDSETADVCFVLKSADDSIERILAHKNILAAASDVFKSMLYGPLKEDGDVQIEDVTGAVFKEFLQFIYLEKAELSNVNVDGVMYLAHKYNVVECFRHCLRIVGDTLKDENVCSGLGLAILYDQKELKHRCEQYISTNSDAVLKSASFLSCDQQTLKYILNMNFFFCSEIEVLKASMAWVSSKSTQTILNREIVQAHLGDAFYDFRFKSVTVAEFAAFSGEYSCLFTADEYVEIIRMIGQPEFNSKGFSNKLRRCGRAEAIRIERIFKRLNDLDHRLQQKLEYK